MSLPPRDISAIAASVEGKTLNQLSPEDKAVFIDIHESRGFSDEQRHDLNNWWLRVTEEDIININSSIPENTIIEAVTHPDGFDYINSDVISDAIEGRRLDSCISILEGLTFHIKEPSSWKE